MAVLKVHQAYGRIVPRDEQTNLRVHQVLITKIDTPSVKVHGLKVQSTLYQMRFRRDNSWLSVLTYVRKGSAWR